MTPDEKLSIGTIALDVGSAMSPDHYRHSRRRDAAGHRWRAFRIIISDEIENLTAMNCDFTALVALLPGVVDKSGSTAENRNAGNPIHFVSMDFIQAVRIMVSNSKAEFGRKRRQDIMAVSKGRAQALSRRGTPLLPT